MMDNALLVLNDRTGHSRWGHRWILAILLAALGGLHSPVRPAVAAPAGQLQFEQGKQLFEAGNYAAASQVFFELFTENPGDPEINFYLGRAAFEGGDYETAIMAFERVLIVQPEAARVKLEIARCHLKLGAGEVARQLFQEILDTNPPEPVEKNIRNYLAAITAAEKRHWLSGLLSVGAGYDDNVAAAPSDSNISIPILLEDLVVTAESAESDIIYSATALLNYQYRPANQGLSWRAALVTYNALYDQRDDLDLNYLGFTTGPSAQYEKLGLNLQGEANQLLQDGHDYLDSYGAAGTLSYLFSPVYLTSLTGKWQNKDYATLDDRDSDNLSLANTHLLVLGRHTVGLTLAGELEEAAIDENSYSRWEGALNYQYILPYDFSFSAAYRYQATDYDAEDSTFLLKRSDRLQVSSAGLARKFWRAADGNMNLAAYLNYTYSDAGSNLVLYEYRKSAVNLGVTLIF